MYILVEDFSTSDIHNEPFAAPSAAVRHMSDDAAQGVLRGDYRIIATEPEARCLLFGGKSLRYLETTWTPDA